MEKKRRGLGRGLRRDLVGSQRPFDGLLSERFRRFSVYLLPAFEIRRPGFNAVRPRSAPVSEVPVCVFETRVVRGSVFFFDACFFFTGAFRFVVAFFFFFFAGDVSFR